MSRYPFNERINKYLAKNEDWQNSNTHYNEKRKLLLFAKEFEELKKKKKVSTTNPQNLTADDIKSFVGYRLTKCKPSTVAHDLSILNKFLTDKINKNPCIDEFKKEYPNLVPHQLPPIIETLSKNDIRTIFDRTLSFDISDWKNIEPYSLVSIGLCSGLRPQELKKLYVYNIKQDDDGYYYLFAEHVKREFITI